MNKSHTVTVNKGTKTKLKMNFSADRQYARPRGPRSRLVRCFLRYSDMKVMTKFQWFLQKFPQVQEQLSDF